MQSPQFSMDSNQCQNSNQKSNQKSNKKKQNQCNLGGNQQIGVNSKKKQKYKNQSNEKELILYGNQLVMPNEKINDVQIPLQNEKQYDSVQDLIADIKSYGREAGFAVVILEKNQANFRKLVCTKSISNTKINNLQNPENNLDQDIMILEEVNQNFDNQIQSPCPFKMALKKDEVSHKWFVESLNNYHNHNLKKKLPQYYNSISRSKNQQLLGKRSSQEATEQKEKQSQTENLKHEFKTKEQLTTYLSEEITQSIGKLWFQHGLRKRDVQRVLNQQRFVESSHIKEFLKGFQSPKFQSVLELRDYLKQQQEGLNNLWFKYDDFQSILSFSLCNQYYKQKMSDIIFVDSTFDKGYNIILVKGLDYYGHPSILFISITPKYDYGNILSAFEHYKQAGFARPKQVIVDSFNEIQDAFEKIESCPDSFQICHNYIIKSFIKSIEPQYFKGVKVSRLIREFKKLINNSMTEFEFQQKFNSIYQTHKDRSDLFSNTAKLIYKHRGQFLKCLIKDKFNMASQFSSSNNDDVSKILKRTPLRNESIFQLKGLSCPWIYITLNKFKQLLARQMIGVRIKMKIQMQGQLILIVSKSYVLGIHSILQKEIWNK
ncbi:UNKNOWN [Stylonychia lemnae]|uniref:Uncharacterized protein n=1 Tax=Stylonychia lemnae TaxID=5949 RepID=A0A078AV65_STYLE|nr:UNKNOWN [Stylonychia lemnae]|eukprot:CDW85881.1 UNKNOWN [Stylonychia lemnae]